MGCDMRSLLSVVRGERSLPFTYWVCYVGGSLAILAVFYGWVVSTASFIHYPSVHQIGLYLLIAGIFFVTYIVGAGVAQSALNRQPRDAWTWIAIAVVVLVMFRVPMEYMGVWPTSVQEREREVTLQFDLINTGLPKRIDELTVLNRVSYARKRVTYHYSIDANAPVIDLKKIKGLGLNPICDIWRSSFESGELVDVESRYLINDSTSSFFVSREDCL